MSVDSVLDQPRLSFLALLWGMIRHPYPTLETISQSSKRTWIVIALLAAITVVLLVVAAAPISARLAREAIQAQLESQPGFSSNSEDPEMQARISQFTGNPFLTMVVPGITGVIGLLIGWLVWSGSLHLLSVMAGGDSHFGNMWQAVVWSYLPLMLRNGIQTIFILLTGELVANQGLSGLVAEERSVSDLMASPPGAGSLALQSLLAQIDLFNIWNFILLFLAVMAIARLSRRKAFWITLGVWGGLTAARILLAIVPAWLASGFA
ncbi:MAG TPA: YIP1 family protein [Anaerolineales bacterium]